MKFSHHTFFIMKDGTVKVCGDNRYGQLGLGYADFPVRTITDLPFTGVKDIVCGAYHTFFIMQDGTIKCCGSNNDEELGLGYTDTDVVSTVTDLPFTGVKDIVCGDNHTFFIMEDGAVKCCGRNYNGELGLGYTNDSVSTVTDLPFTGVKDIVCGRSHTFFIMQDGSIKCCGNNEYGQLGLGHTNDPVTTVTNLPFTGVKNIVCGAYYTFFIMQDGTIKCCGINHLGQLGLGHTNTPVSTVTDLPLANVKKVVCGGSHTFFIMRDGTIKCCGINEDGELGLGYESAQPVTTVTDLPFTGVKDIVCGYSHTFFIMNDNTVKACGDNQDGKLGIGLTGDGSSPVTVPGIPNFDRFPHRRYDNSRQHGEPVQSPPIQIYDNSRVGNPEVSSPIYIPDTTLREGLVKFTLIGEMKDGSHAPIDILNTAEWFVDNTEVAEIQDGYLIPKKEGSVLITAKIGDIVATTIVIIKKAQLYAIYASKDIVTISKGSVITVEVQGG